MSHNEENAYILGTDREELHRLGLQHQVWSADAQRGWELAGFRSGQTLLDLGCGPGYCTQELGFIAGPDGNVIGVDQSAAFIRFAEESNALLGLPIDYRECNFDDLVLAPGSLDGAWCRWALAWLDDPAPTIEKVIDGLKPGGVFVAQEYLDWRVLSTQPHRNALSEAINVAYRSMNTDAGDIEIGRRLPELFEAAGLCLHSVRPMARVARPNSLAWRWPDSFWNSYLPRLVAAGLLDEATRKAALADWQDLSNQSGATCICPVMTEVIGRKPA